MRCRVSDISTVNLTVASLSGACSLLVRLGSFDGARTGSDGDASGWGGVGAGSAASGVGGVSVISDAVDVGAGGATSGGVGVDAAS